MTDGLIQFPPSIPFSFIFSNDSSEIRSKRSEPYALFQDFRERGIREIRGDSIPCAYACTHFECAHFSRFVSHSFLAQRERRFPFHFTRVRDAISISIVPLLRNKTTVHEKRRVQRDEHNLGRAVNDDISRVFQSRDSFPAWIRARKKYFRLIIDPPFEREREKEKNTRYIFRYCCRVAKIVIEDFEEELSFI